MANFTEQALTKAMRELLEEYPLDRITVKDLTERCDVSRNTFYYHFHDIYELVEKMFMDETERLIRHYQEEETWESGFLEGLEYLYENKKMINHIYRSVNREELDSFLNEVVYRHALTVVAKQVGDRKYGNKTLSIIADFYKNAVVGAVISWIERDMRERPEELASLYNGVFVGTLDAALESVERIIGR